MGLTERHWFENEDVPENYEWALEDAVYNSHTNKKHDDDIIRCEDCLLRYTNKCVLHEQAFPINKGSNWFCADGKRKDVK